MQIYGSRKCQITRKAERFFNERNIPYHFVDLAKYTPSRGELDNMMKKLPAGESLINPESPAFKKRGLAYMIYDEIEEILANPLLLKTPIVREASRVIVGDDEGAWKALVKSQFEG